MADDSSRELVYVTSRNRRQPRMSASANARLAGIVATTMGVLSLATPALAAPAANFQTPSAPIRPAVPKGTISSNVTVGVIGKLPKVNGPTYVYHGDNVSFGPVAAATSLPFNFAFTDVSYGVDSAHFTATKTSVCIDIAVRDVKNPGAAEGGFAATLYQDVTLGTDPSKGQVAVPVDNKAHSYCFPGISSGQVYYFEFGFGSGGGSDGVYEYVDGSGTVRNS